MIDSRKPVKVLWGELLELLPADNVAKLHSLVHTVHDDDGAELLRSLIPFVKLSTKFVPEITATVGWELCSVALDAYQRGGTATLFFRKLVNMAVDERLNKWVLKHNPSRAKGFARSLRKRRGEFKIHEWLVVSSCMQNYEKSGTFLTLLNLSTPLKYSCADELKSWRKLVEEPSKTFRFILDDDRKTLFNRWNNGRTAIPMSAWYIMKAIAHSTISLQEAYLLDYDMLRMGCFSDAAQKIWDMIWNDPMIQSEEAQVRKECLL